MINNARESDAGPYVCTATNVLGTDRRRVDLDVWGKIRFFCFLNKLNIILPECDMILHV